MLHLLPHALGPAQRRVLGKELETLPPDPQRAQPRREHFGRLSCQGIAQLGVRIPDWERHGWEQAAYDSHHEQKILHALPCLLGVLLAADRQVCLGQGLEHLLEVSVPLLKRLGNLLSIALLDCKQVPEPRQHVLHQLHFREGIHIRRPCVCRGLC